MKMKRETIYRCGALAYAVIVGVVGLLVNPIYLVLLVPIAFARPVLRELSLLRDADEREMLIIYRSSHIAFYVVLLLLVIIFLHNVMLQRVELPAEWYLLIIVPVFAKFAASIIMNYSLRKAGLIMAWLFGAIWTGFALLSHGFSVPGLAQSAIGLSILAGAAVGTRWRHIGGPILVAEGGVAIAFILGADWPVLTKLLMSLVLGFPLILAGLLIFASRPEDA